ncbi:hypothetical protein SLEP1_g55234 [Rubroshorea leprosula]|uniref:RNase H type-1 domain-containing protein n=1 Tax=Rubroshorea leprosula TaxID=152421 RepID=A0AAV5MFW7_9ROSI|nr:hypothetical protein SLEP1_g55234 [Rubroshorea leprosula]
MQRCVFNYVRVRSGIHVCTTSSFIAELWGCRDGLRLTLSLGIHQLVLEMDSLLAVQMIQGRKMTDGFASVLFSDIFSMLNSFDSCVVQHTLQEGNFAADFMPWLGQRLSHGTIFYQTPPSGIEFILQGDIVGTMFCRS